MESTSGTRGAEGAVEKAGSIAIDRSTVPANPPESESAIRLVDRLPPALVRVLTVAGFGIPVSMYLWMLHTYAVNVINLDQFDDLTVIRGSYVHYFDWHLLWAQHNETRIFFPNLVVVALAHVDHFNIVHEEYLSACMLLASIGLLIWAHKRRSPDVPWLYYCPIAFLLLSLVQWHNTLWGFQFAWYLVLLSLMAAIFFLDRIELNAWSLAVAAIFGVVGSMSLIQGFLIWPVGLFLLYHRRRLRFAIPWLIVAVATAIIYFRNFDSSLGNPYPGYASHHLWASIRFFVFEAGDIVGVQPKGHHSLTGYPMIVLFGAVMLIIAAWLVMVLGTRRDSTTGTPIGVVLILFASMFALMVTQGRVTFGLQTAGASRYTTYDLLFLCGIYLAILGRTHAAAPMVDPVSDGPAHDRTPTPTAPRFPRNRVIVSTICIVTGLLIVLQSCFGYFYGIKSASNWRSVELREKYIEVHVATEPGRQISGLYLHARPASWVLQQLDTLEEHHLSFYALPQK